MQRKKKSYLKILAPIVAIALLAFLFWCCIFPKPSNTVNKFLKHLTNQRLNLAYEMTSLEFQELIDLKLFKELSNQLAVDSVKKINIQKGEFYKDLNPQQIDYEVTFEYAEFDPETFDVKLIRNGRKWDVNSLNVDSDIYEQL